MAARCVPGCADAGAAGAEDAAAANERDAGEADAGEPTDAALREDVTTPADSGSRPDVQQGVDVNVGADVSALTDGGASLDAGACNSTARSPRPGDLVLNEVLFDPAGDANGDGTVHSFNDEFIEIANVSDTRLELNGVAVFDSASVRHVFGAYELDCGGVVVIFGGGVAAAWPANWIASSEGSLTLNNDADEVRIEPSRTSSGTLDRHAWGSGAATDESLVRSLELDFTAPFVRHSLHPDSRGARFSPGARVDGTRY